MDVIMIGAGMIMVSVDMMGPKGVEVTLRVTAEARVEVTPKTGESLGVQMVMGRINDNLEPIMEGSITSQSHR
jgi:hypothetical protein